MSEGLSIEEIESVLDLIPLQIAYRNLEGKYIYCNKKYASQLGINEREKLYGKKCDEIDEIIYNINKIKKTDDEVVKRKTAIEYEEVIYINNKKYIFEINKAPIIDNNNVKGILSLKKPISYKEELDKLKEGFFYNLKHEFRTPINVIITTIQLLENKLKDFNISDYENLLMKSIERIRINSLRILKLSNNFIDLTSAYNGNTIFNFHNYDIVSTVEDICLDINNCGRFKNLRIIFDTEIEEKIISFDKVKLERIIMNLISNSIKFNDGNRIINVTIYLKDNKVNISVKDNGYGISEKKLETIFDEFSNSEKRLNKVNEGCGVGLAIVKHFVEAHKGKINVKSELGKGSEFIIEMPDVVIEDLQKNTWFTKIHNNREERITMELSDIYE